jgi:hypothetical protein
MMTKPMMSACGCCQPRFGHYAEKVIANMMTYEAVGAGMA